MYGGFSGLKDDLMKKLDVCVRNGKRKLQTSDKDVPSICVIDDISHNIDDLIIESVLFGNLVEDRTKPPRVLYSRESDGKWSDNLPSELTAVFVLKFIQNSIRTESLYAYLCPNPKHELYKGIFAHSKITWRSLNINGLCIETLNK
jgi:hypothetical protein